MMRQKFAEWKANSAAADNVSGRTTGSPYKLLLVGDSGVGKSSLLLRFVDGTLSESSVSSSGVNVKTRTISVNGKDVALEIRDKAEQDGSNSFMSSHYRGADGIILVFDVTNTQSFNNIKQWLHVMDSHVSGNVNNLLVGNKCDLSSARAVTTEQAKDLAQQLGVEYVETSAKNTANVEEAFTQLAFQIEVAFGQKMDPEEDAKADDESEKSAVKLCRKARRKFIQRGLLGTVTITRTIGVTTVEVELDITEDDLGVTPSNDDDTSSEAGTENELSSMETKAVSAMDKMLNILAKRAYGSWRDVEFRENATLSRSVTIGVVGPLFKVGLEFGITLCATVPTLIAYAEAAGIRR